MGHISCAPNGHPRRSSLENAPQTEIPAAAALRTCPKWKSASVTWSVHVLIDHRNLCHLASFEKMGMRLHESLAFVF